MDVVRIIEDSITFIDHNFILLDYVAQLYLVGERIQKGGSIVALYLIVGYEVVYVMVFLIEIEGHV